VGIDEAAVLHCIAIVAQIETENYLATCGPHTGIHLFLLELLLAAPVWRADGSDTAATVAAATPWGATPWQRQWQGDSGNDGLAFFHSSVFCTLSSRLLHTST